MILIPGIMNNVSKPCSIVLLSLLVHVNNTDLEIMTVYTLGTLQYKVLCNSMGNVISKCRFPVTTGGWGDHSLPKRQQAPQHSLP